MHETKVNTENADVTSSASKKAAPTRWRYRPEIGPQPPLVLVSTNIGLGHDLVAYAQLQGPAGDRWECDIEQALRIVDLIQEPYRTKLLASAELHYSLPVGAMMGQDLPLTNDSIGGQQ
ncbi:hypothetical protein [Agrobacterium tumefaciens]|uniref:hypothetical protein n=1 Tax=Agrobacterium tumefaciens TaxID=358 RepID=UPI00157489FA|nr:hypothetical protein [Agrobacterium tumefaciens]NTB05811.1 hypothetical protein [Agrobacterium tumefaciens]